MIRRVSFGAALGVPPRPAPPPLALIPYGGGELARGRAMVNRAELVWQMWCGYTPDQAAARVGLGPRALQRHITALLTEPVAPCDWITAQVVARLRRRVGGEAWEDTVPRAAPARNGWPEPVSRAGRAAAR